MDEVGNNPKYVFSSSAQWLNGSYGPDGSSLTCKLGLTAEGRVELTLQNGKLLFSAPVALTKRRYESAYGWIRFVVGPRLFTVQFYIPTPQIPSTMSPGIQLVEAREGSALFEQWKEKLDQATAQAPDSQPIIAAELTPSLKKFSYRIIKRYQIMVGAILLIAALVGLFMYVATTGNNLITENVIWFIAGFATLIPILLWVLVKTGKQKHPLLALDMPAQEIALGLGDILPSGTRPTGNFGFTQGKQLAIGIGIGLAIAITGIILGG